MRVLSVIVVPSPETSCWTEVTSPLLGARPYALPSYWTFSSESTSAAASVDTAVPQLAATFWILLV